MQFFSLISAECFRGFIFSKIHGLANKPSTAGFYPDHGTETFPGEDIYLYKRQGSSLAIKRIHIKTFNMADTVEFVELLPEAGRDVVVANYKRKRKKGSKMF